MKISRRGFIGTSMVGALAAPALAQGTAATTLRFMPQANLTALDPIWSSGMSKR